MSHSHSPWAAGPFVAASIAGLAAHAQSPCVPVATPHAENVLPGVSGIVSSMATWDPDAAGPQPPAIVASGFLNVAGTARVGNVARLDPASGTWSALGSLPTFPFLPVLAVSPQNQLHALAGQQVWRWTGGAWSVVTPMLEQTSSL